jgi:hypothetical protein
MGKSIRRGRTSNVRCASCGQLTRRDRAVYLFRNGIKTYYCPDCAKRIHGQKLFKGAQHFIRRHEEPKVKRKFVLYSVDKPEGETEEAGKETPPEENTEEQNDTQS